VHKEGAALSRLSRRVWCAGENTKGEKVARDAVALLEALPPSRELAMAYGAVSSYRMNIEDAEDALLWGGRASSSPGGSTTRPRSTSSTPLERSRP